MERQEIIKFEQIFDQLKGLVFWWILSSYSEHGAKSKFGRKKSMNLNFKRRLWSQNFFRDPRLVAQLVGQVNFGKTETVIDIGAGTGIITEQLARRCKRVVAVEIDPELVAKLRARFQAVPEIEIQGGDFRQFELPRGKYKVFANIPFHITSEIVYKLMYDTNPPEEAYLVLPKEAAEKFGGVPGETQFSILAKPWFEMQTIRDLETFQFVPQPKANAVFWKLTKRNNPLVAAEEADLYRAFIKFAFNTWRKDLKVGLKRVFSYGQWKRLARDNKFKVHTKPTELTFAQWLAVFRMFRSLEKERNNSQL